MGDKNNSSKPQHQPKYQRKSVKLDRKNNQFTSKKFHKIRKVSSRKKMIKSLGRIGMCLNDQGVEMIPSSSLEKVCFILINDNDKELGVGPVNDGYLIALRHHQLGYKVFYLYNTLYLEFVSFLWYFLGNTTNSLTVFYSGKNKNGDGIEFSDCLLKKSSINDIISSNCNGQAHVVFITDSLNGGSVFDITDSENVVSFSVKKQSVHETKNNKRSHGIFTFYFCKLTEECENITPDELVEKMDEVLSRFNESLECEMSSLELRQIPIIN